MPYRPRRLETGSRRFAIAPTPLDSRIGSTLFGIFGLILAGLLIYVFYASQMRSKLEESLFDLRTRLKPPTPSAAEVAVVTVDDHTLAAYPHRRPELMLELARQAFRFGARAVGIVLPHQDFAYDRPSFQPLLAALAAEPRLYLGVFDQHRRSPHAPPALQLKPAIESRVAGAGTMRRYRHEVIRTAPLVSYLGEQRVLQLPARMAQDLTPPPKTQRLLAQALAGTHSKLPRLEIDFRPAADFPTYPAEEVLRPGAVLPVAGHAVLIGYTAFRRRSIIHRDGTHFNTPWDGEGGPEPGGTPLVFLHANVLDNLLAGTWLRPAHSSVAVIQTALVSGASFLVWQWMPAVAVTVFVAATLFLLALHCILFAWFHLHVPLADTLLFAVLATIAGAFGRAQRDGQKRMARQLKLQAQGRLAHMQAKFLDRFAIELYATNAEIQTILGRAHEPLPGAIATTLARARQSCQELGEYLAGIKQYAKIDRDSARAVSWTAIPLQPLIAGLIRQFDDPIAASELTITVDCPEDWRVTSDEHLLTPIVFNLISNAVKYSPRGGVVAIRASASGDAIELEVQDEGPGIAPELQDKIFEKFYRIKDAQVYRVKGNGLGLYLCRYFAAKLKAPLWVESELGNGSTFKLRLRRGQS